MIGVDTNVLVRFVTRDDREQSQIALGLVETVESEGGRLFVGTVVLCELVWTLSGRGYGYSRNDVAAMIERLLETPVFEIEARSLVRGALSSFKNGPAGFADYLLGHHHRSAGCAVTATFDRRLADSDLFQLLA